MVVDHEGAERNVLIKVRPRQLVRDLASVGSVNFLLVLQAAKG